MRSMYYTLREKVSAKDIQS